MKRPSADFAEKPDSWRELTVKARAEIDENHRNQSNQAVPVSTENSKLRLTDPAPKEKPGQ